MSSVLLIIYILSFIFGVLSTIGIYFGSTAYFLLTLGACTAVCIPASLINKRTYRLLVSLLPFLTLLAPASLPTTIACGVACACFAVFMALGNFYIPYYKCKKVFMILMVVMLLITLVTDLVIIITPQAREYLNLQGVCIFLLCMLFSGVFTLRAVRAGEASLSFKWNIFNFSSVAATVAVLASAAIVLYLALAFLFSFIRPLEERDLPEYKSNPAQYESNNQYTQFGGTRSRDFRSSANQELDESNPYVTGSEDGDNRLLLIVSSIITVAGIAALILIKRNKRPQDADDMQFDKQMSSRPDYTNRQKVRLYFRTYMASRGTQFTRGTTSEDVAKNDVRKEAQELREIYIRARYSLDSEISDTDVQNARNCLDKCTGETEK